MKKTIYAFAGLILTLSLCFSAKANSGSTCFTDVFGYVWKVSYTGTGGGYYTATGTVDIGSGTLWNVVGSATVKHATGPVQLTAINPSPDGCNSYTDSFAYYGTTTITHGNFSYTGSGSWESYCFGGVLNTGTWDASGPCQASAKNVNPNGPASHTSGNKTAKNSMNTVCFNDGFYNWKVTYTDQGGGYYTCTGTVNVDGIDWSVYGSANFMNHMSNNAEFHASNPYPDGCTFYVDSFTYYDGVAQISGTGSGTTFSGYGNWVNYCFGATLNYGSWAAYGPCGALKSLPYGPAKHAKALDLKVSPNPMKSNTTVTYQLSKESQVKITLYNYMQQPVQQVVNKVESAGKHSYVINGSTLTNGVYRLVAVVDGQSYSSSVQVVK